jgi:hypothetical protein
MEGVTAVTTVTTVKDNARGRNSATPKRSGLQALAKAEDSSSQVLREVKSERIRLSNKLSAAEDATACVVCPEKPRRVAFMPCSHFICCQDYSEGLDNTAGCLICRSRIEHRIDVIMG